MYVLVIRFIENIFIKHYYVSVKLYSIEQDVDIAPALIELRTLIRLSEPPSLTKKEVCGTVCVSTVLED